MATTFRFPQGAAVRWPPVCVVCGDSRVIEERSFGSSVDDFKTGIILSITENKMTISFPLCLRHRLWRRGIRFALVGASAVLAVLFLALFQVVPEDYSWLLWALVAVAIVGLFLMARAAEPVRVFAIIDEHFKIQIRNDIYARAFAQANGLR